LKKLYVSLTLLAFIFTAAKAQLLVENFSYTGGSAIVGQNAWASRYVAGTGGTAAFVSSTGLSYSGYSGSGVGNALTLASTAGEDVYKNLSSSINSGSVFVSFMLKVDATISTTGGLFLGCATSGASSVQRTRVYIRTGSVAGTFNIGLAKNQGLTTTWASTDYTIGTTYLIALKYTFNVALLDDTYSLWVNPTVNGTEDPSPILTNISDAGVADLTSFGSIVLYQGGSNANTSGTGVTIDGLKVSTLWGEILSAPLVDYYYKGTGDLQTLSSWGTALDGSGTAPSNFTSPSQSFNIVNTTNAVLTGSWTVSGSGSKIIVPALDTLTAVGGATINASTIDIASTGAYQTDNFSFPTWGSVAGSVLLNNASGFNVSPGTFNTITIPSFSAGGDFIVLNGDVNMNDNALTVAGKLQINGSNKIIGTDVFTLNNTGALRIGHPEGITASNPNGAIQMAFARNFNPAAQYTYLGTGTNLVTGDGLPADITGTLTIRLLNATDIITLSQTITGNVGSSLYPTISLTSGLLSLGNNTLTLGSMINGSSSSYVITEGTGTVRRPVSNTGGSSTLVKNFYVGTTTEYRLLSITFPKTIGTAVPSTFLTVGYNNTDPGNNGYPSGIVAHSTTGYWTLGMSVKPDSIFTLSVITTGMAGGPGANFLRRTMGANDPWVLNGGSASITATSLTETSCPPPAAAPITMDIALGYAGPLPVNLVSFSGNIQKEGVQLAWRVTDESSIDKYEIERSADGNHFEFIGFLDSKNVSTSHTYSWLDKSFKAPVSYYRLKIIGQNGDTKYSSILKFQFKGLKEINVSPNPIIDGRLNLSMSGEVAGVYSVSLFDALGRQVTTSKFVHSGNSAVRTITLNNNVQSGIHYLVITGPTQEKNTIKINIVR
jgi:hypothetical protein